MYGNRLVRPSGLYFGCYSHLSVVFSYFCMFFCNDLQWWQLSKRTCPALFVALCLTLLLVVFLSRTLKNEWVMDLWNFAFLNNSTVLSIYNSLSVLSMRKWSSALLYDFPRRIRWCQPRPDSIKINMPIYP